MWDALSDFAISKINYTEQVKAQANIRSDNILVNNRVLQESAMLLALLEPVTLKITREHISVLYVQGIEDTTIGSILDLIVIPYQENQPVDYNQWNSIFDLISLFRVN